jgi:hypothetical protein
LAVLRCHRSALHAINIPGSRNSKESERIMKEDKLISIRRRLHAILVVTAASWGLPAQASRVC